MIPMPPTSSEMEATMARSAAITWLLLSCASAIWLRLRTLKSLTWSPWIWWSRASVRVTWLIAVVTRSAPAAWT